MLGRTRPGRLVSLIAGVAVVACGRDVVDPPEPVPAQLVLSASDTLTVTGGRLTFSVQAVDSLGTPVSAGPILWTVSNTGRGTVTDAGVFTGGPLLGTVFVRARLAEPALAESVAVTIVRPGTVKWRWAAADAGGQLPVIGGVALGPDGTVYALVELPTRFNARLVALDSRGALRWAVELQDVVVDYPVVTPAGDILVVGKRIYLVRPNGTIRWEILTDADSPDLRGGAATTDLIIAAMGEHVAAWDLASGDSLWQTPYLILGPWLVPPTIVGTSHAYAKQSDDSLFMFDLSSGDVLRTFPDPDTLVDKRVFGRGTVLHGTRLYLPTANRIAALDTGGPLLWLTDETGRGMPEPAIGPDGTLYVQNRRWGLEAIAADGSTRWYRRRFITPTGGWSEEPRWSWYGGAAVAQEGIIYGAGRDRFFAYSVAGDLLWDYQVDSAGVAQAFEGAPAIGPDGIVYTFTSTHVYAFWASAPPDSDSPWPMWRHDAQRTGWVR